MQKPALGLHGRFCENGRISDNSHIKWKKFRQNTLENGKISEFWPQNNLKMEKVENALQSLKKGNERFVTGSLSNKYTYAEDRKALCAGQHPFAVVLCCSDSRVVPEIIFDQKLGDLFVIRNAGNIVDEEVLGSIEYAVEHLETPLVVVMGHSSCGAVTATCQGGDLPGHILDLAKRIKPSINTNCCIDDNAKQHAKRMAKLIEEDKIVHHVGAKVVAAFYDLQSGKVEWL